MDFRSDLATQFVKTSKDQPHTLVRLFRFPENNIYALRDEVCTFLGKTSGDTSSTSLVSADDVTAVLIWCHVTKARHHDLENTQAAQKISQLWRSFDLRSIPALGISKDYVGNTALMYPTNAAMDDLIAACEVLRNERGMQAFSRIVVQTREKPKTIDDTYALTRLALAKACDDPRRFKPRFFPQANRDLVYENKTALGRGLDFSEVPGIKHHSKPTCARVVHPGPINGVAVAQPSDTITSKDLIEVLLPLYQEDMYRLVEMDTWKQMLDPDLV